MVIIKDNCRLCQKDLGTIPLEEDIVKIILKIVKIEINNDTGVTILPTSICLQCNNKILDTNSFITEIQNVNNYLKSCMEQNYLKTDTFECPICSKSFRRLSSYKSHQKIHRELYCSSCNEYFKIIEDHKCDKKKNKKDSLKNENDDSFDCLEDGNSYLADLKVHNKYICSEENCLKKYTTAYSLKMHKLNHEGKRSFLCVSCGKDFISKKSLICHEKIHAPIKPYKCENCNVSFSVRSNFRAHIKRYHEGVRYHCSQCPREFLTKCNLDRHEKIHAGVREFKCEQCTSAFYTKKELIKHQRYHQGLKQHKCEQCYKTFFERHHLIIHQRSHSGERPYVCEIPDCGKSFYDNQKLKRHKKALHVSK